MLKDVQGQVDQRHIALKQVGIRDIRWPITLKDPHKGVQHSVAVISLGVNLPHEQRGTHMSRFVECLKEMGPIHPHDLEIVLDGLKEKLGAKKAMLDMRFHTLLKKRHLYRGKQVILIFPAITMRKKGRPSIWMWASMSPSTPFAPAPRKSANMVRTISGPRAKITIRSTKPVWIEELVEWPRLRFVSYLFVA